MTTHPSKEKQVVIIGCGIFGLSTAYWMLKKGGYRVTLLEKNPRVPAPDAASCDINKLLRNGDYPDPDLAALNVDAIDHWADPIFQSTYHESGIIVVGEEGTQGLDSVKARHRIVNALGLRTDTLSTPAEIHTAFNLDPRPTHLTDDSTLPTTSTDSGVVPDRLGPATNLSGYINRQAGWAEAERACRVMVDVVLSMGAKILPGMEVKQFIIGDPKHVSEAEHRKERSDGDVEKTRSEITAVVLQDGTRLNADLVVVATGAWTFQLFTGLGDGCKAASPDVIATGQSTDYIQLTEQEMDKYKNIPGAINATSSFYCFPPDSTGLVKLALHAKGYVNPTGDNGISRPLNIEPHQPTLSIPRQEIPHLRAEYAKFFPHLTATKDFVSTRLCFYTDSSDGHWLIDWHPDVSGLLVATAGSGHAFKFFPVIGREVLARIEDTLSPSLAHKWRFMGRKFATVDSNDPARQADSRGEGQEAPTVLRLQDLATSKDLKAPTPVGSAVA